MSQELQDYIAQARKKGFLDAQIYDQLIAANWNAKDVAESLGMNVPHQRSIHQPDSIQNASKRAQLPSYIISIFLALVVSYILFLLTYGSLSSIQFSVRSIIGSLDLLLFAFILFFLFRKLGGLLEKRSLAKESFHINNNILWIVVKLVLVCVLCVFYWILMFLDRWTGGGVTLAPLYTFITAIVLVLMQSLYLQLLGKGHSIFATMPKTKFRRGLQLFEIAFVITIALGVLVYFMFKIF